MQKLCQVPWQRQTGKEDVSMNQQEQHLWVIQVHIDRSIHPSGEREREKHIYQPFLVGDLAWRERRATRQQFHKHLQGWASTKHNWSMLTIFCQMVCHLFHRILVLDTMAGYIGWKSSRAQTKQIVQSQLGSISWYQTCIRFSAIWMRCFSSISCAAI